jgi:hypothetical protein
MKTLFGFLLLFAGPLAAAPPTVKVRLRIANSDRIVDLRWNVMSWPRSPARAVFSNPVRRSRPWRWRLAASREALGR